MATSAQIEAAEGRIKGVIKELSRLKGWSGVWGLAKMAPAVVDEVESAGAELGIRGAEKKAMALDILCYAVPDAWLPDSVVRWLGDWAIESAVRALKARKK